MNDKQNIVKLYENIGAPRGDSNAPHNSDAMNEGLTTIAEACSTIREEASYVFDDAENGGDQSTCEYMDAIVTLLDKIEGIVAVLN